MKKVLIAYAFLLQIIGVSAQEKNTPYLSMNTNLVFAGGEPNHGFSALHFGVDLTKQSRYTFGLTSGIESQTTDTFTVTAIPLFFSFQIPIVSSQDQGQIIYFLFRPGISFAYDIESKITLDSIESPLLGGKKSNDASAFIKPDFFYSWGVGYESRKGFHVELFFRNQPSNLYIPYQTRNTYLGIGFGYRIK